MASKLYGIPSSSRVTDAFQPLGVPLSQSFLRMQAITFVIVDRVNLRSIESNRMFLCHFLKDVSKHCVFIGAALKSKA